MTNDELLHKWINGSISKDELKTFKLRPEYDSLRELYKNTGSLSAPDFDRNKMLSEILGADLSVQSQTKTGEPRSRRLFLSSWIKYGVAASVLLFAGWFLFSNVRSTVSFELAKGERLEETLPDGSTFILNAGSSLSYNRKSWTKTRSLELSGEAFFNVKPGSTFRVITPTGDVEVLGTTFNVWSRDAVLEVKCQSGKVKVRSTDGSQINDLAKNQAIRLSPGQAPLLWKFPPSEKPSWVEGITSFKSVQISRVIKELERQFDIEIDAGTLNINEIISCNFPHQDLEIALQTALGPLGIQHDIRDKKKVYLYK